MKLPDEWRNAGSLPAVVPPILSGAAASPQQSGPRMAAVQRYDQARYSTQEVSRPSAVQSPGSRRGVAQYEGARQYEALRAKLGQLVGSSCLPHQERQAPSLEGGVLDQLVGSSHQPKQGRQDQQEQRASLSEGRALDLLVGSSHQPQPDRQASSSSTGGGLLDQLEGSGRKPQPDQQDRQARQASSSTGGGLLEQLAAIASCSSSNAGDELSFSFGEVGGADEAAAPASLLASTPGGRRAVAAFPTISDDGGVPSSAGGPFLQQGSAEHPCCDDGGDCNFDDSECGDSSHSSDYKNEFTSVPSPEESGGAPRGPPAAQLELHSHSYLEPLPDVLGSVSSCTVQQEARQVGSGLAAVQLQKVEGHQKEVQSPTTEIGGWEERCAAASHGSQGCSSGGISDAIHWEDQRAAACHGSSGGGGAVTEADTMRRALQLLRDMDAYLEAEGGAEQCVGHDL